MSSIEREVSEDQEAQAYMRIFSDAPEGAQPARGLPGSHASAGVRRRAYGTESPWLN